jgi:HPt (histidine-containing phosphotransfer) domain-containing protein
MNTSILTAENDGRLVDLFAGVEDAPDLDTESLLRRCMNRPPLARQLLTLFEDQLPSNLDNLYAALRAGDHRVVHQEAPLLRGSAANLSAERLREIAVVLERRAADRALTPAEAEPIIAAIEAARAAFTAAARAWRA